MDTPVIDICIPTFEPSPQHLAAALESLQKQTFARWRAIVSDDPSKSSDTASMIHPFLADPRFSFKRNQRRLGIGGNWNACLKNGNSSFVAFLFQDDLWAPGYLQQAMEILEKNSNVGFISLGHEYFFEGDISTKPTYLELQELRSRDVREGIHRGRDFLKWWIDRELHPNFIGEPSFVVIRRSALSAAGKFLKDMPQFLDVEYWTRLLTICDWYNLRGNWGSFRVHPGGASAVNQQSGQGLFDRLRCFERLIAVLDREDRTAAIQARNRALEKMAQKFFGRLNKGSRISTKGSGVLRSFCIKHPILTTRIALKAWKKRT
jgi:glycosyltransferase involved in cell wall biosynthesis